MAEANMRMRARLLPHPKRRSLRSVESRPYDPAKRTGNTSAAPSPYSTKESDTAPEVKAPDKDHVLYDATVPEKPGGPDVNDAGSLKYPFATRRVVHHRSSMAKQSGTTGLSVGVCAGLSGGREGHRGFPLRRAPILLSARAMAKTQPVHVGCFSRGSLHGVEGQRPAWRLSRCIWATQL